MAEYISKQDVIDYLNGYLHSLVGINDNFMGQCRALINVIQDISAVKAADVQSVKHGEWKFYKNNGIYDTYKCSICKESFELSMDADISQEIRYCPNCGARMNVIYEDDKDGDTEC